MNPVDDQTTQRALLRALQRHVDHLAASIPGDNIHSDHERRQRIAGAWVYLSAVVAWAEDHGLVDVQLRAGLRGVPARYTTGTARPVLALSQAIAGLTVHPATQWLIHDKYNPDLHAADPSDDAVQALADWWASDAPSLAYQVDSGPESITGWVIGELLQLLSVERRRGNALAQTPWWVCDFILDRTMVPALQEFRHERLIRTIDPACGTGHFLVRTMDYLWEWYTTGRLARRQATGGPTATGGTVSDPSDALTRLVASVDGVELDPLTAAVARLRCTAYAAHLAYRGGLCDRMPRLDEIPRHLIPRIGVGDSLLLGKVSRAEYDRLHPALAGLPGASFTGGDWDWQAAGTSSPTAGSTTPIVISHQQLDLLQEAAR